MKLNLHSSLLALFLYCGAGITQPPVDWIQTFDNGANESFYDIYLTADNHLIMCGGTEPRGRIASIFVVKLDEDGNNVWQSEFEGRDGARNYGLSLIELDDGDYVIVGRSYPNACALRITSEGEEVWFNTYDSYSFNAVIELKGGDLMLAGYSRGDENQAVMTSLQPDGDLIWQRDYGDDDGVEQLRALREMEDGVIATGFVWMPQPRIERMFALKVDFDGEPIWINDYEQELLRETGFSMCSTRDGFIISGATDSLRLGTEKFFTRKINSNGQELWADTYDLDFGNQMKWYGTCRLDNDDVMLVGYSGANNLRQPSVQRVSPDGVERWHATYDLNELGVFFNGVNHFLSIVQSDDGALIASGQVNTLDGGHSYDAIVMKLEPDQLSPIIMEWSPHDTVFSVLPSDSVMFWVRAQDQQGDELAYLWHSVGIEDVDTLGTDTTVTITFEELGEYFVQCQVSDGEFTAEIRWHVTSGEWYIDTYTPDSLSWTIRRPREVDFELGVRAIEGVEPQFRWILTGHRGAWEDVGDDANLTYEFDRPGEYSLEGRAFHEDIEHSINWQIAVRSVLYWWTPHDRELTIDQHDEIEFNLLPFNPNSDSLDFRWLIDGEYDENELDAGLFYSFGDLGDHSVTAIVHDGAEVDTVIWSITVEDPNEVKDGTESLLPTEVTLYPAAPNPFNSTTSIRYFLPRSADVRLTIYDSAGRLVHILAEDLTLAGEHRATLHGAELSTGVYLLRLKTGDVVRSMKVVLLK